MTKPTKTKPAETKPRPAKTAPKPAKTKPAKTKQAPEEPTRPKPRKSARPRRKKPTETEERFAVWMSHMGYSLDLFMSRLPEDVRSKLDYSVESLDVLEAWLLDRYPDIHATRAETDPMVFDGAARYIGETFRKTLGGQWYVDPKGKIQHGLPHMGGFRSTCFGATVPLTLATSATDRREGNMLSNNWRKKIAWIAGKKKRSPLLDHKLFRKHIKVTSEEEQFQSWLDRMDTELGHLFAALPEDVHDRLDYSPESLDVIEAWLLARYPDGAAARAESQVLMLDGVARYVGETFRRTLGGQWWFDLEGWSHNGLPQVVGFADAAEAGPVCPLALAHAAADTRRGDVLRAALRARRPRARPRN